MPPSERNDEQEPNVGVGPLSRLGGPNPERDRGMELADGSPVCGARPSAFNVACLLDAGHQGPHRWWDEHGDLKWVPHSEPWRNEPAERKET